MTPENNFDGDDSNGGAELGMFIHLRQLTSMVLYKISEESLLNTVYMET